MAKRHPEPIFEDFGGGVQVTLFKNQKSEITATPIITPSISDKIIALLMENSEMSITMLANSLGTITRNGVKYHLTKLKREGKIKRIGPARGGHWEITKL